MELWKIMELWKLWNYKKIWIYENYGIMDLCYPLVSKKIWNYGFVLPPDIQKFMKIMELWNYVLPP